MKIATLRIRIVTYLNQRVRNGELTERGLARLTGVSQPHMHNILKGVRILSPELADHILEKLGMSVFDVFESEDWEAILDRIPDPRD